MATQGRIFMTGASGYIGSVITEFAVADGYNVHGLSRSEANDEKLRKLGAVPVRGDLESLEVLRRESAEADIVIHLASAFQPGKGPYEDFMPVDIAALEAIAEPLKGTGKAMVITAGTLFAAPDPSGGETNEESPADPNPIVTRNKFEKHALNMVKEGIRVTSVRLAPYVYGRGGSGVKLFMGMAAQSGRVIIIDGGKNYTTTVHVDDAARLYLLAAQKGQAGEIFNASGATDVTAHQLYSAIAAALGVPLADLSAEDALAKLGQFFSYFLKASNRASGAKAKKVLGWQPTGKDVLEEINHGSYQAIAESLRKDKAEN